MATKIYHDSDADLNILKGKKIAVIGYGNQGRAQALCLHDSGLDVVVGARRNGESWGQASSDGLKVAEIPAAVKGADVVMVLLPDEVQPGVYKQQIAPNLKEGAALEFAHGFAITFKCIAPPAKNDVIMVAPKSPGRMVRQTYLEGFGVPSLIAVQQDATGKAKQVALALAKGLGSTKAGVLETDFREEATSDLFGEQAVLCGGVTALIEAGFETLVKAGYKPEIAYFEVLHELKLIVDLIQAGGMMHMWDSVSNTAEFGGLTRRDAVINDESKKAMKKILEDINSGKFAKEWSEEWKVDLKNMKRLEKEESEKQVEAVGKDIRALFERK
ncbi:ketol-acid reductoisomerase [Methanomassiliicoccus luminyensis]|uniref:ketol-acid reductoisomerase n=1 Tax=Methanomassiliicoccus luminyensis TaxID=1080712 RepID=UPI0003624ABB|nr:ketol-acid reductoisomerase [Methanomassiliicoccus luminyensis]